MKKKLALLTALFILGFISHLVIAGPSSSLNAGDVASDGCSINRGNAVINIFSDHPLIASSSAVYHGNVSSKIFHSSGCRYFNCKNCTAVFTSRDAAIKAGYRPCKICSP